MFWLAVIGGSLIVVHLFLLLVLKFRRNNLKVKFYGALVFPRFELFLMMLAVPCFCYASAVVIKGGLLTSFTVFFF